MRTWKTISTAGSLLVLLLAGLLLAPAIAWAQAGAQQGVPLGDIPRRQRDKKEHPKPSRVYTNDDISRERPGAATGVAGAERLAPFVPSPEIVVERMLQLAKVRPDDTVYDLGCGDGRILIMAAQKFGAGAGGVELDDDLHHRTLERVKQLNLEDKIKVIHGDMLQVDLEPASVVTLYLLTSANEKLRPLMEKQLKPGARVVSHDFPVPGWEAAVTQNVTEGPANDPRQHVLYLYRR